MGGKGQRRREKNYRAAHGGYTRLPPPPKPNEPDVIPSKLRQIINLTTSGRASNDTDNNNKKNKDARVNFEGESSAKSYRTKGEANDSKVFKTKDKQDGTVTSNKKKAKRKREQVKDLRFEATENLGSYGSKKRERKKKYAEAKKNKHKKAKIEVDLEFPGHEDIKFGDIVDAPPKLLAVPKKFKKVPDASHERLRLQAIEAYRNRKGWGARPGILPPHISSDPSVEWVRSISICPTSISQSVENMKVESPVSVKPKEIQKLVEDGTRDGMTSFLGQFSGKDTDHVDSKQNIYDLTFFLPRQGVEVLHWEQKVALGSLQRMSNI